MAQRICLFPGSFDPVTKGHVDIIERSLPLFDKIVVGIGINSGKQAMFSAQRREEWIREIFKNEPRVDISAYEGLTVEFCKKIGAQFILRGVRYVSDFEYEKGIADMNRMLHPGLETFFLTSSPEFSTVSSTLVRDVIRNNGNVSRFVPDVVQTSL